MQFSSASIESIKSIEQRDLALLWNTLAEGRAFPSFLKLEPDLQNINPRQLVVWTIESTEGGRCFRALFNGTNVAEAFNSAWAGKTMDSVIPEPLKEFAIEAADECAVSGCAIYMIISTSDGQGRRIDCERLLLPFGRDGAAVEQIVGSLQLVSVGAAVERSSVLGNFQKQAEVIFAGKIAAGFSERQAAPASHTTIHRKAPRHKIVKAGTIKFGETSMTCDVRDISKTGAALEVSKPAGIPDAFALVLEMESVKRSCVVVWRSAGRMGVRFD
jgi:hypothetical protein